MVLNSAADLIQAVRERGGQFLIDGDRLGIVPATAAAPLVEQIRQHKAAIIELLAQRPAMPSGVHLVSWNPKAAPVRLSECSVVTDTEKFIYTTLMQLEAQLSGKDWLAGGWGLSGLLARLEAVGCVVALDDPKRALQ